MSPYITKVFLTSGQEPVRVVINEDTKAEDVVRQILGKQADDEEVDSHRLLEIVKLDDVLVEENVLDPAMLLYPNGENGVNVNAELQLIVIDTTIVVNFNLYLRMSVGFASTKASFYVTASTDVSSLERMITELIGVSKGNADKFGLFGYFGKGKEMRRLMGYENVMRLHNDFENETRNFFQYQIVPGKEDVRTMGADKTGYLYKEGGQIKTWKNRWFALKGTSLFYYKSPTESEIGIIDRVDQCQIVPHFPTSGNVASANNGAGSGSNNNLSAAALKRMSTLIPPKNYMFRFEIHHPTRTYVLAASDEDTAHNWIKALTACRGRRDWSREPENANDEGAGTTLRRVFIPMGHPYLNMRKSVIELRASAGAPPPPLDFSTPLPTSSAVVSPISPPLSPNGKSPEEDHQVSAESQMEDEATAADSQRDVAAPPGVTYYDDDEDDDNDDEGYDHISDIGDNGLRERGPFRDDVSDDQTLVGNQSSVGTDVDSPLATSVSSMLQPATAFPPSSSSSASAAPSVGNPLAKVAGIVNQLASPPSSPPDPLTQLKYALSVLQRDASTLLTVSPLDQSHPFISTFFHLLTVVHKIDPHSKSVANAASQTSGLLSNAISAINKERKLDLEDEYLDSVRNEEGSKDASSRSVAAGASDSSANVATGSNGNNDLQSLAAASIPARYTRLSVADFSHMPPILAIGPLLEACERLVNITVESYHKRSGELSPSASASPLPPPSPSSSQSATFINKDLPMPPAPPSTALPHPPSQPPSAHGNTKISGLALTNASAANGAASYSSSSAALPMRNEKGYRSSLLGVGLSLKLPPPPPPPSSKVPPPPASALVVSTSSLSSSASSAGAFAGSMAPPHSAPVSSTGSLPRPPKPAHLQQQLLGAGHQALHQPYGSSLSSTSSASLPSSPSSVAATAGGSSTNVSDAYSSPVSSPYLSSLSSSSSSSSSSLPTSASASASEAALPSPLYSKDSSSSAANKDMSPNNLQEVSAKEATSAALSEQMAVAGDSEQVETGEDAERRKRDMLKRKSYVGHILQELDDALSHFDEVLKL